MSSNPRKLDTRVLVKPHKACLWPFLWTGSRSACILAINGMSLRSTLTNVGSTTKASKPELLVCCTPAGPFIWKCTLNGCVGGNLLPLQMEWNCGMGGPRFSPVSISVIQSRISSRLSEGTSPDSELPCVGSGPAELL